MRFLSRVIKWSDVTVDSQAIRFFYSREKAAPKQAVFEAPQAAKTEEAAPEESKIRDTRQTDTEIFQAQAQEIIESAKVQAQMIYAEARESGYKLGQMLGEQSVQERTEAMLSELSELIRSIQMQKDKLVMENEAKITGLALSIAKNILQTELESDDRLKGIFRTAVEEIRDQEWIKLTVSDRQLSFATENADELKAMVRDARHIEIVGQKDAPLGTCIVETRQGIVDASANVQLDRIREAFEDV